MKIIKKIVLLILICGASFISSAMADAPFLYITNTSLSDGIVGDPYSQTLIADGIGYTLPLTWNLLNGFLPPGLSLVSSTGVVSGTPTATGVFSFTIQVTDANNQTAIQNFNVVISLPPQGVGYSRIPEGISISNPVIFTQTGVGCGRFEITLASGIRIDTPYLDPIDGVITQTLNLPLGDYTKVRIRCPGLDAYGGEGDGSSVVFSVTSAPLFILTANLSDGIIGNPYSQILEAGGGALPLTWSVVSGSLPPGIVIQNGTPTGAPQNKFISGTPTATGVFSFTIQVTDANNATSIKSFSVEIFSPPPSPGYSRNPTGFAISNPVTFTQTNIGCFSRFEITPLSGVRIDGPYLIPTDNVLTQSFNLPQGDYTKVRIRCSGLDAYGGEGDGSSVVFSVVLAPISIANTSLSDGIVGDPYSQTLIADGGTLPLT